MLTNSSVSPIAILVLQRQTGNRHAQQDTDQKEGVLGVSLVMVSESQASVCGQDVLAAKHTSMCDEN